MGERNCEGCEANKASKADPWAHRSSMSGGSTASRAFQVSEGRKTPRRRLPEGALAAPIPCQMGQDRARADR
ncbi:hypothetical protein BRADI_4g08533v3 [Brachypodium distachyon]|uniref:Uncharacterized protein n=1 Tax=Brachypodium distachyon TaxID=15368 RepID=A0A2K2CLA6_BRADI|nr:hypothetical protein BRADI_4g08533v3 [Brachypodium distachyon]